MKNITRPQSEGEPKKKKSIGKKALTFADWTFLPVAEVKSLKNPLLLFLQIVKVIIAVAKRLAFGLKHWAIGVKNKEINPVSQIKGFLSKSLKLFDNEHFYSRLTNSHKNELINCDEAFFKKWSIKLYLSVSLLILSLAFWVIGVANGMSFMKAVLFGVMNFVFGLCVLFQHVYKENLVYSRERALKDVK